MSAPTTRPDGGTTERPYARDRGMAAVHEHEVVAVRAVDGAAAIDVTRWRDEKPETARHKIAGLHGWVRAGRITVATADGDRLELTLLGEHEAPEARLGDHWPPYERSGLVGSVAATATHHIGAVVRVDRGTRTSGERNDRVMALIAHVRRASPDVVVGYGSPFGHDQWEARLARGSAHKGILGRPGDLSEL